MSSPSTLGIEIEVFHALCWKVATPVAYKAYLMSCRSDWLGLLSMKIEPAHYSSPLHYLEDIQIVSFFKKYKGFQLPLDLEARAIDTFWDSERQCYLTNERLSPLLLDLGHYGKSVKQLIATWRKDIRAILGRAPNPTDLSGRFGPGSTYGNRGDLITLAHKLSEDYTSTRQATSFLHSWDLTAWSRYAACSLDDVGDNFVVSHQSRSLFQRRDEPYAIRDFDIVRGNRFTTVPKDATKVRGICVEPSLNVFYQLALGGLMSDRMRRKISWDKKSCQDYHRNLARIGSLTGAVSTIDLSNASDTVAWALVKLLLPADWFGLVDRLRSAFTLLPSGRWVKLEKFSSMGNGFTFELETLLFVTLARSLVKLEGFSEDAYTPGLAVSCFGDDIIIPTSLSASMIAALSFFGFTANERKTFTSGPFRESCGGDFFAGHDVRPHFQKEICEEPHHIIALANGVRRYGLRSRELGRSGAHLPAWFRCIDALPRQISICRGPSSLGDLVIHDDESRWLQKNPIRVRNSIRYLRVWRPVPNRVISWDQFRPGVVLSVALYGGSSGTTATLDHSDANSYRRSGWVPRIRGSYVSGYRFGRVAFS